MRANGGQIAANPLVVVLTCRRPNGAFFLEETVRGIDGEGGADLPKMIVVDGDEQARDELHRRLLQSVSLVKWELVALGTRKGSTLAMHGALATASQSGRDVLFFEDDVRFCRGAVRRMRQMAVPADCAGVSFFDMKELAVGAPPGLYHVGHRPGKHWTLWGCQCLLLPAEMVLWLAQRDWMATMNGRVVMASDTILAALLLDHRTRRRFAMHIPCLVEHVGDVSACFPGIPLTERRVATNFPGVGFEALSLPPFDELTEPPEREER